MLTMVTEDVIKIVHNTDTYFVSSISNRNLNFTMLATTPTLVNVINAQDLPINLTNIFGNGFVHLNSTSLSYVSFSCMSGYFKFGSDCIASCIGKYELAGECFTTLTTLQALRYSKL